MAAKKTPLQPKTNTSTPIRYRKAKPDASIESIQKQIEKMLGLTVGSVKLVYPSGRKVRIDSTVGALRTHWKVRG